MSESYPVKGRKVLVVGLGKSGVSLTKYLSTHGAKVTVTDERNKSDLKTDIASLEALPHIDFQLGRHVLKTFQEQDLVIVSPGVPMDSKPIQASLKEGIPVIGELEFAASTIKEPIIAVTGTNGKSTTVTLIHDMISRSGAESWLGGNIGTPLMEYVNQRTKAEVVVAEVSSFQLETAPTLHCHTAVILNVTPDHLDRHKSFDLYVQSKGQLLKNLSAKDGAIYNARCPVTADIMGQYLPAGVPSYAYGHGKDYIDRASNNPHFKGAILKRGILELRLSGNKVETYDTTRFRLPGTHNKENLAAAAIAARLNGASREGIQKTIDEFTGLEHRMEFVVRKNAVNFINDSKATNVDSMVQALQTYKDSVILIAGGRSKSCEFETIVPHIKGRLKAIILYGEAKEALNRAIGDHCETLLVGTFEESVLLAYQKSRSGDTVLLSPGCSSLDMFESYAERGRYFKQLVSQF